MLGSHTNLIEKFMNDQPKYNTDCYVFLLSKAYQKGRKLVQKRLKPYGLTNVQYLVLEVLWQKADLTAVEIGTGLNIDKATMSGILERMVDSELIVKKQDELDSRMMRLFPSEAANAIQDEVVEERKAANEELLVGFSLEEKVLLRRLLLDIV